MTRTSATTRPVTAKAYTLANNFTTASNTAVDTNLGFTAKPNTIYSVKIIGSQSKGTANTGIKMQVTAPTGSTISGSWFRGVTAPGTALQQEQITAINTLSSNVFGNATNTVFIFRAEFFISIGSTGGDVKLAAAAVTSGTLTIYAGTGMDVVEAVSV